MRSRQRYVFPFGLPLKLECIRDAVRAIGVLTMRSLRCSTNKRVASFFYSAGRVTVFVASHSLLSLSRDSVRKVAKIGSDEPPIILRPRKLDAHRERIVQMLAKFDGKVVKVHRALADGGTIVPYSTLTAFCRNNHLLASTCDPRRSVVAARQWLLELVNGRHSVERLQSQLPPAADLRFLFSQLKHGRSRHRKKAATILARKRGISNSVIATALRSSRSTTRRYYKMYLEAGPEKLFAWNTTRHMGAEAQFSDRTKRILEVFHHKPTAFGINRTNWTQPALLKAYEQSYGEIISRSTLARILRRAGYRWRKARRVLTSPDPRYHEKVELLLNTLRCLGENEMFFFLDEWGPIQVRKRGGKAYRNDHATIPRHQVSRGSVSLIARAQRHDKSGNMVLSRIKRFTLP